MTQEELQEWYEDAREYYPDNNSKREGYLEALEDLAERLGLNPPVSW